MIPDSKHPVAWAYLAPGVLIHSSVRVCWRIRGQTPVRSANTELDNQDFDTDNTESYYLRNSLFWTLDVIL